MTKLVVCVALFRFPRSDVWLSSGLWCPCWPRFERSPRGRLNLQCGGAVHIEGSLQGDRESLQSGPIYSQLFALDLSLSFQCVWVCWRASCSAVCLGQWRDRLGRGLEGRWTPPCSPFRRFKSELSKTALTGYAARDLLPSSLEGGRSRLGPLITPLPGSKRRTCALWVLLIVKAINWLFCAGWTKRVSSMRHTRILSGQQDHEGPLLVHRGHVVHCAGRSPCEAGHDAAATTTSARSENPRY